MTNPALSYYPAALLREAQLLWEIQGSSVGTGQTASGAMPMTKLDGGGLWKATLGQVGLWSSDKRRSWRALSALADGGSQPFIVPVRETVDTPWPPSIAGATLDSMGVPCFPQVPHSQAADSSGVTTALFSDGTGYENGIVEIQNVGGAALRATSMTVKLIASDVLHGGEYFSIDHPVWRWRLYRIATAVSNNQTGNDSFTKALLHFDADFSDSNVGGAAHVWTAAGTAQVSGAQSRFGGASGLFDGVAATITTPHSADFVLGTSDFTIDFWFRCNAASGTNEILAAKGTSTREWYIQHTSANIISVQISPAGFLLNSVSTFTNAVNTGWHHLAVVRQGSAYKLFIDGVVEASTTDATAVATSASEALCIGAWYGAQPFNGNIDEFRLSVGIARWTSAFVPSSNQYGVPSWAITFRPPLRAAINDGTFLEFDHPKCVMRLDKPEAMDVTFSPPLNSDPSVTLIEAFPPFPV